MVTQALLAAAAAWLLMTAWMGTAWLFQRRVDNAGWVDVFWTFGTGLCCVLAAIWPDPGAHPLRQMLVALLAGIWSARLGVHLARRVGGSAEDLRYAELREKWGDDFQPRLLRFIMWQPPVTAVLVLSVFCAAHILGEAGLRDIAGLALLGIAIAGEAIADDQMRRYKAREDRPPVMEGGLWGRSRHPNYFFEWLGWMAYPTIAFSLFEPASWLTILAPTVMYLVLRYGTGVAMTEASMLQRKGAPFRDYQRRVNAFFPSLLPSAPSKIEATP